MLDEIMKDAETRMNKTIDVMDAELKKVRTGRAHPSLLNDVMVSYYGTPTPLNQVANIGVEEGRTLTVTPWEKHIINDIQKAILASDLGLNPSTSGDLIRLPLPPLTEETRNDLIKVVRAEAESGKVGVRNIRRDANSDIKDLLKEKEISEDEARKGEEQIQKITDRLIGRIDEILAKKEEDLMTV